MNLDETGSSVRAGPAWKVAILGATGAVGRCLLQCLEASPIQVSELTLLASPRSAGTRLMFQSRMHDVTAVSSEALRGRDLILASAGAAAADEWLPEAARAGAWVVDNSSRFRLAPEVPLIVPEVNGHRLPVEPGLIANPNCSTIQLVVALAPIAARLGLRRVVVATYQSASGKGQKGLQALQEERDENRTELRTFPHRLLGNVIPQVDLFVADGYTREEEKMLYETRKILDRPELPVHPTCVRVPVDVAHSEAVFVETERETTAEEVRTLLDAAPGVRLLDEPLAERYPMPVHVAGTDSVWVGRIRRDRILPNGIHLWVVADNLRKGAALNAVQIAETLWRRAAERMSGSSVRG